MGAGGRRGGATDAHGAEVIALGEAGGIRFHCHDNLDTIDPGLQERAVQGEGGAVGGGVQIGRDAVPIEPYGAAGAHCRDEAPRRAGLLAHRGSCSLIPPSRKVGLEWGFTADLPSIKLGHYAETLCLVGIAPRFTDGCPD